MGLSPPAARKWIDNLTIRDVNRPLNLAMGQVYPAIAECDRPRHEVFVLTDLARSSWIPDQRAEGLDKVEKAKTGKAAKIATFILRLGSDDVSDVAILSAEPAATVATQGDTLEIRGLVQNLGSKAASRVVEFYLDGVKKGDKPVELPAGGQLEVNFMTPPRLQDAELHQGELRLSGTPDPLEFNDRRFFTFKVRPALKVLLISDLNNDDFFVAAALDPDPSPSAPRTFEINRVRPTEFLAKYRDTLKNFSSVFLLNVASLDEECWELLNRYVHEGGGLVVGLGDRCQAGNYNGPTARQVMAAALDQVRSAPADTHFGKVADVTHPLFERNEKEIEPLLAQVPIYRYWSVKPSEAGTRVLLSYADSAPALLERTFKGARTGRVLLWTTPLARRADRAIRKDQAAWNDFPLPANNNWSFLALMNLTVPYLAGTSGEQLNFEAGENVLLALGQGARYQSFLVTGPDPKNTQSLTPTAQSEYLEILAPQMMGQWTVMAKDADGRQARLGFSLNAPQDREPVQAARAGRAGHHFRQGRLRPGRRRQDAPEGCDKIRVGIELFPWIMMLIMIVVTLENLLANTFYKESSRPTPAGAAA